MVEFGMEIPAVSMAEAQVFARVETGEEEALLAGLVRTASALCESFTGQLLVSRDFAVTLPAGNGWQKIGPAPVRAIAKIEIVAANGSAAIIPTADYEIDIDGQGDGWVRLLKPVAGRVKVSGTAGMAADCNGVPEPLRQGILRLVAHLFAARDRDGGNPPAAVTALWQPYRRMRLA
jgi:uncharacterized phiE125 gp8 family phage protein